MQANIYTAVKYASAHLSNFFPKRKVKTGVWASKKLLAKQVNRTGEYGMGLVTGKGGVCSTVCAAVNDWAAWKISGSRSRCKAWPHCGCGCAGPGSWSWRMTWRSEDTCEVWPLCATWSGSACQTYWGRSPHTSGTYRRRDTEMGGRDGRTRRKKRDTYTEKRDTREDDGKRKVKKGDDGCWKETRVPQKKERYDRKWNLQLKKENKLYQINQWRQWMWGGVKLK